MDNQIIHVKEKWLPIGNDFIKARFNFSKRGWLVFFYLLERVDEDRGQSFDDSGEPAFKVYKITADDLMSLLNIKGDKKILKKAMDKFFDSRMSWDVDDGEESGEILWHIFSHCFRSHTGDYVMVFDPRLVKVFLDIKPEKGFTYLFRESLKKITHKYAFRMYMFMRYRYQLKQYCKGKKLDPISVVEFARAWQLPKSYYAYKELNRSVLTPSVADVSKYTDVMGKVIPVGKEPIQYFDIDVFPPKRSNKVISATPPKKTLPAKNLPAGFEDAFQRLDTSFETIEDDRRKAWEEIMAYGEDRFKSLPDGEQRIYFEKAKGLFSRPFKYTDEQCAVMELCHDLAASGGFKSKVKKGIRFPGQKEDMTIWEYHSELDSLIKKM
jgi:hypothetical protein